MHKQTETPTLTQNLRHLYADVAWYGVLAGSAMAFLGVYAARLGASALQVGLLTAGPAAVSLVSSLQAARWLGGRPFTKVSFWSSITHRLVYALLIPLPWLLPNEPQVWGMILLVLLGALPGTLLAIAFNATYAELVPPDRRTHVTGRRNAIVAITLTASSILSGLILQRAPFPQNFQAIFALGSFGAFMSCYHLYRLRSTNGTAWTRENGDAPIQAPVRPEGVRFLDASKLGIGLRFLTRSAGQPLVRLDLLRGSFGRVLFTFLLFYTMQHLAIPLFPLYWVQELNLTDVQISIGNAMFYGVMMLSSISAQAIQNRFQHRGLLLLGALGYGAYPLLNGLARDAGLYWVASFIGGWIWGLLNVALVDHLFDRVPADDRPAHMALHNLVLNIGILSGSLLGPLLAGWLGLRGALLFAAAARLASAGLFLFGR